MYVIYNIILYNLSVRREINNTHRGFYFKGVQLRLLNQLRLPQLHLPHLLLQLKHLYQRTGVSYVTTYNIDVLRY